MVPVPERWRRHGDRTDRASRRTRARAPRARVRVAAAGRGRLVAPAWPPRRRPRGGPRCRPQRSARPPVPRRSSVMSPGSTRSSTSPNVPSIAAPVERRERFRINLFLDPAASPTATWINGIGVPEAIARLCTCDGTISPVFVDDSLPVSVGRSQRIVPERTRRAVLHRDKKCRNPLCAATRGLEVHHVVHWHDLGGTDTLESDRPVPALPPGPPPRPPRHLRQRRSPRRHHVPRRTRPGHRHRHPRGETTRAATRPATALPASPRRTPATVGDSVQPVTPGHELTCDFSWHSPRGR